MWCLCFPFISFRFPNSFLLVLCCSNYDSNIIFDLHDLGKFGFFIESNRLRTSNGVRNFTHTLCCSDKTLFLSSTRNLSNRLFTSQWSNIWTDIGVREVEGTSQSISRIFFFSLTFHLPLTFGNTVLAKDSQLDSKLSGYCFRFVAGAQTIESK